MLRVGFSLPSKNTTLKWLHNTTKHRRLHLRSREPFREISETSRTNENPKTSSKFDLNIPDEKPSWMSRIDDIKFADHMVDLSANHKPETAHKHSTKKSEKFIEEFPTNHDVFKEDVVEPNTVAIDQLALVDEPETAVKELGGSVERQKERLARLQLLGLAKNIGTFGITKDERQTLLMKTHKDDYVNDTGATQKLQKYIARQTIALTTKAAKRMCYIKYSIDTTYDIIVIKGYKEARFGVYRSMAKVYPILSKAQQEYWRKTFDEIEHHYATSNEAFPYLFEEMFRKHGVSPNKLDEILPRMKLKVKGDSNSSFSGPNDPLRNNLK